MQDGTRMYHWSRFFKPTVMLENGSLSKMKKILIVGPAWVGDMVMAQSLLKLLKERHESICIDVLAPAWTYSLLKCMPEVSQALLIPFSHGDLKLWARYQLAKKLRADNYDQAIVLPNSFKSALIPWLARIPLRTGWLGEYRYGLLNDVRFLDKKKYLRMVDQFVALGLPRDAQLPNPFSYPSFEIAKTTAWEILAKHKIPLRNRPLLALCPGAEYGSSKRWPTDYFANVANQKIKAGWDVWLFGSAKDQAITAEIMAKTNQNCENIAGRTELYETIHLLSFVKGLVTNDSGLMHIAAALNKPVVALYGSTSPAFTPPLSAHASILQLNLSCQPCFERECPLKHHRCMRDLTPDRVVERIDQWSVE